MDTSNTLYLTLPGNGAIPEQLTGNLCAYMTPEDALRNGGLWRNSGATRLLRVEPIEKIIESNEDYVIAEAYEVLGLANVDSPLFNLSRVFGVYADEMYVEQSSWRRALLRPLTDAAKVEECLKKTLETRGLELWEIQKIDSVEKLNRLRDPEEMYAWGTIYAQTAFEAWRDASVDNSFLDEGLRTGWTTWFTDKFWDDVDYAAEPEPNSTIDWTSWDAWAALTVYYTSIQHLTDFPNDLLTDNYRDAYQHGMLLAAPIKNGILGYCMV